MRHFHKRLKPAEEDLHSLLWDFTSQVSKGAQPSFATFKDIWAKRHFSWIFLGNNSELSTDKFVQGLYGIILDCLDIPMSSHARESRPVSASTQQQRAQVQAGSFLNPADDQYLHQLMLGDEFDTDQPETKGQTHASMGIGAGSHASVYAAHNTAANNGMGSCTQTDGRAAAGSPRTKLSLGQPAVAGTTLALVVDAGKAHPEILQAHSEFNAPGTSHSPASVSPSPPLPPPSMAGTEAGAVAPNTHRLTSNPDAGGHASHNRLPPCLPTGDTMAGVSLLDALPDVPLRSPPSSGPKNVHPPPLPSDAPIPILATQSQPGNPHGSLQHTLPDVQLTATASVTASLQPAMELSLPPTQSGEHSGPPSSNLFMTEADLLLDSPKQAMQSSGHDLALPVSNPPEASAGPSTQPSNPALALSGASLAARAAQRRKDAPAAALILPAASAAAAAASSEAAAAPNRNMHIKATPYPKHNPAKVPLATKVGSLYAIYCLHETQPGRVPVYLPLELLHQLLDIVKEAHAMLLSDVMQVVTQLMHKRAFVVGAVRRPPRSSAADEAALEPPNR
ncbi:hypothetical protein ABBQ38_014599 [Trebouxia sp. C0009 RCD-2024]